MEHVALDSVGIEPILKQSAVLDSKPLDSALFDLISLYSAPLESLKDD